MNFRKFRLIFEQCKMLICDTHTDDYNGIFLNTNRISIKCQKCKAYISCIDDWFQTILW